MITRIFLLILTILYLPSYVQGVEIPGLLEMLAEHPGKEAVYIDIYDSTSLDYSDKVYVYRRSFRSYAMVLRQGAEGVATLATPVISQADDIVINAFTITPEAETLNIPSSEMTLLELPGNKERYALTFPDARAGAVFVFEWHIYSLEPVFSDSITQTLHSLKG